MYLKKLELVGFKSFLNKTTLHFEPGITAVVGPNGCGKSNIFDSILWVLGEQSVKALRGSDMQDVIFNGTDSKEPLSMAEVNLTFDNKVRFFNVDNDEVVITRRLFRSGESEYLLNKNLVRLKDIQDLLMGTGIGSESYSLVAQGKIDLILSSRPEDRRLVFDEAAGITKYKQQKKETMHKLEETEQNLLRVNDIITEVKRQIGSLERQANKARRYKEVFEELKLKEINLALLQKRDLFKQKELIIKELQDLEKEEARLFGVIKEQESKISNRQIELKSRQDNIMTMKNEILNLDNLLVRSRERIAFNQERIRELEENRQYLENQIEQVRNKLALDEEKLNSMKAEYAGIKKNIETKTKILKDKEQELNNLTLAIKVSLENISSAKKEILGLVSQITNTKNEITELNSKNLVHSARKRRLELEKAKVNEEKSIIEDNLKGITQELENLNKIVEELNLRVSGIKNELSEERLSCEKINSEIENLERQKISLNSHKEFIEKLSTKYKGISESLNAVIYLDRLPKEDTNGLVIKIKGHTNLSDEDKAYFEPANFKLTGEAKPIDLDTQKIIQRISQIQQELDSLKNTKIQKDKHIEDLNKLIGDSEQELRNQDIALANKKASYQTTLDEFNKIKEEQDIIVLELSDLDKEVSNLEEKIMQLKIHQVELDNRQKLAEELVTNEQTTIALNSNLKENVLVAITQIRTELDALNKRIDSDEATVKILEETFQWDKDSLFNMKRQVHESTVKKDFLVTEIGDIENKINEAHKLKEDQKALLIKEEELYRKVSDGTLEEAGRIEQDRKELNKIKNKLYELQMQGKDVDFKFMSIKDRILQSYKIDIKSLEDIFREVDESQLSSEIQKLKEKLDSIGSVNLVAIEEYDELKKRYDFLVQQQNDLLAAKESLHQAILKINRITKQMFWETFEKVRVEFRNYFRLLFNGGDAQIFLIDEQDPLESGIEIICRPLGKKLQNVLLLSGGERALSAIALIFAVFKVKPTPFCVLDEIDAALDEANVDRFSRTLQEFVKTSQFIVITHNKRTIANADVMYGITMEESGVSKIVSVKFAQDEPLRDKELKPFTQPAGV